MSAREMLGATLAAGAVAVLACVPLMLGDYGLSLAINIVSYTVLATAWSLFSGPTRYVSLATVAFFGIGAYTTAVFVESLAWPLVLLIATIVSIVVAAIVGLSTLRLSGVYFVIFSFGLAALVRQLVTWFEVNKTRTLGRYVFTDITATQIYWQLLALAVLVFAAGLLIGRSRDTMRWMRRNGVRFIPMFGRQSYKLNGKHHFYGGVNIEAVGGGYGLVDQLLKAAERNGIEIRYATRMTRLLQDRMGTVSGVTDLGQHLLRRRLHRLR